MPPLPLLPQLFHAALRTITTTTGIRRSAHEVCHYHSSSSGRSARSKKENSCCSFSSRSCFCSLGQELLKPSASIMRFLSELFFVVVYQQRV